MKRFPWDILLALLIGVGLGISYAWVIAPQQLTNATPSILRTDFKDQFREAIAASYASTGNLARAQARLSLLGDVNSIDALNSQAQRTTANGRFQQADQLAALALSIENGNTIPQAVPPVNITPTIFSEPSPETEITAFPSPADLPFIVTETPQALETQINNDSTPEAINTIIPRPTRTPIPTPSAPLQLTGQDTVCDAKLPEGLLQIIVFNTNRRQLAGIKIQISWDTGEEEFFTGFKSELGNGYADFIMTPNLSYAIQPGGSGGVISGVVAPTCQTPSGETFTGGYKLTFQQP